MKSYLFLPIIGGVFAIGFLVGNLGDVSAQLSVFETFGKNPSPDRTLTEVEQVMQLVHQDRDSVRSITVQGDEVIEIETNNQAIKNLVASFGLTKR